MLYFHIFIVMHYFGSRSTVSNRETGNIHTVQCIILTLGINWIWFNSFMGLILKDTIGQMLLRSGIDVLALFIGVKLYEQVIVKKSEM